MVMTLNDCARNVDEEEDDDEVVALRDAEWR